MTRLHLPALGAVLLLVAASTTAYAGAGGGQRTIPGGTDIRAVEAPVNVRDYQLRAQEFPYRGSPGEVLPFQAYAPGYEPDAVTDHTRVVPLRPRHHLARAHRRHHTS